ncbi:hypothetical protein [Neorhizobium galegae]|uniref:hypothetical protein n=1 Tax=Neorhizobium galegae TaxID=399 RepID=UPI002106DD11|nr:hypothetical protein [Neorhizobium galegae]MCQ1838667.1 hypothetical protein [Neorhizobium galegae]
MTKVNRARAADRDILAGRAKCTILHRNREKTMGLHKLEIEVDDEILSRIDAAAARQSFTCRGRRR